MNGLRVRSSSATQPLPPQTAIVKAPGIRLWQLNLLRVAYFEVGVGLAITRWPGIVSHQPWELKQGTLECMLLAVSLLALLGLRYPRKMVPILLFEVAWKAAWLTTVAVPLWLDGNLSGATAEQLVKVLWVVVVTAATPWRYVFAHYVLAAGDPWRRPR